MQTMYDDYFGWVNFLWFGGEGTRSMIVDRFDYGFSTRKEAKMLRHQLKIVGLWSQSGDTSTQTGCTIKDMIVVETDMRDTFFAEELYHTIDQSCFP